MRVTASQHGGMVESVTLNGEDLTEHCFIADTKRGFVGLYVFGESGKPILNAKADAPLRHYKRGDVQVKWKEPRGDG